MSDVRPVCNSHLTRDFYANYHVRTVDDHLSQEQDLCRSVTNLSG